MNAEFIAKVAAAAAVGAFLEKLAAFPAAPAVPGAGTVKKDRAIRMLQRDMRTAQKISADGGGGDPSVKKALKLYTEEIGRRASSDAAQATFGRGTQTFAKTPGGKMWGTGTFPRGGKPVPGAAPRKRDFL